MSTKSRQSLYGISIQMSAARAKKARKEADRLACDAWNMRMLGYKGPAQPSPSLGDALKAGFGYLEVRCLGWTRTKPSHSILSAGPSTRRSTSSSATCDARTARSSADIRTNEVVW
jgi:hypothetical protein